MTVPSDVPAVEALLEVIVTLRSELEVQRKEGATMRQEISRLVKMVEGLTQQLDVLLRDRNEERRAELAKALEDAKATLDALPGAEEAEEPEKPKASTKKSAGKRDEHGRKSIPEEVPRDTERIKPQQCPNCGGTDLNQKKVLVSEAWDYVRAHLRARRLERVQCECRDCLELVTPEQPPMPFERTACTFEMMAWLVFAKSSLFLPLDRVRRDFQDQGATIPSSTLTRWWQQGADLLQAIAEAVRLSLLSETHIRTDGTGLYVVFPRVKGKPARGAPRAGTPDADGYLPHQSPHRGQILIFGNDDQAVFHYTNSKHGYHAVDFLTIGYEADGTPILWKGTITADAVSSQNCLFNSGDRIEAGCNAHGFRKFHDDADKAPLLASRGLAFIGRFYSEEGRAREKGLKGEELLAWRQEHVGPVAAEFRIWIDDHLTDLLPGNPVRKAMQYYINHWAALTRFLHDPEVELDNNWSERGLRSVNLIRNNSLYAGGEDGAVRLCTSLTLITTCRLIKVDPYEYLVWALSHVVPHRSNRGLTAADLTPAAYKQAQQAAAQ